ncbi:hypothetical protein QJT82_44285, partial [Bradyrhizobium sp. Mp19]|nr:hypothetical protein [Bradyrhizobium sp. Mp19]
MPPSPIDPARLAALPADLRALFRAQEAMIEAERRRADDECSARLHVESELAASKESVERLELLVKEYERAGPGCLDSAPLDLSGFLPGYAERGA